MLEYVVHPILRFPSRQDLFWISLLIACLTTSLGTSLWNQISVSQTYNAIRHSCRRHFRFCTSLLIFWKGEQLKYSYLCHFAPFCANTSVYEILLVRFPKQSALDAVAVFRSSCIDATAEPSANDNSWVQIFVPDKYQTAKSLGSSFEIHNFFEDISYASTAWATAFPVSTLLQIYAKPLGQQGPDFGNCYSSNVPARPSKELQISTEKPNLLWNLPISEYWRLLNPRGSCTGAKED